MQHDPAFHSTRRSPVVFDPGATCPKFVDFLVLILPNEGEREYALRLLSLLLLGENVRQIVVFFHGAGGNGKSTLLRVLEAVLGEYYQGANIELFLTDRYARAGRASPEEVDLPGARAIVATDPDARDELSAKKLKAFTGGDLRTARALHKGQFTYRPTGVPIIAANRLPQMRDDSEGFWRRFNLVPFRRDLRNSKEVTPRDMSDVLAELLAEAPGVLNLLLDYLPDALKGLAPPASIADTIEELKGEADPVGEFLEAATKATDAPSVRAVDLYAAFKEWIDDPRGKRFSQTAFGRALAERGVKKERAKDGYRYFRTLVPLDENPAPPAAGEADRAPF
jgi:P4 family phage/plasmid primase-like protien